MSDRSGLRIGVFCLIVYGMSDIIVPGKYVRYERQNRDENRHSVVQYRY